MYRHAAIVVSAAMLILLMAQTGNALEWTGSEGCEQEAMDYYVELMGYQDWNDSTNKDNTATMHDLTFGFGNVNSYNSAGAVLAAEKNPIAANFLPYARSYSLMDQMIDMPTTSNEPEDVKFDLPDPSTIDYTGVEDLLYMPIKEMASLIESQIVSCVEVTEFFISQTKRLDPLLAIVSVPLFESAMITAEALDEEIAEKGTRGALTCIPFALKDHHQIEDEPTTYGHILNYNNIQTEKSTIIHDLMKYGAIPIAKTMLGAFAWGAVHGWGMCLSPYLNGQGCGSSCGSGSGAAAGIFPFAVSEETWGSIACPAAFSFISGYLPSYGVTSRQGAGLLSMEFDHIGFHSRYISDYGIILNYMRSGVDPMDGDSVAFEFEDPAKIDPSSLSVLVIGEGASCSYAGMTCHKWSERYPDFVEALEAAGATVDVVTAEEANKMWSFNSTDPMFEAVKTGDLLTYTMTGKEWGELMNDNLSMDNSRWQGSDPKAFNMPFKEYNYVRAAILHFGKLFLSDPVWDKYDVIIDSDAMLAGDYDMNDSNFEQWVRTSKVFLVDYYEDSGLHPSGYTTEAAYATLTALPWDEAKSFAVGAIIQEYPKVKAKMKFPDFEEIEELLTGRDRCATILYDAFNMTNGMIPQDPESPSWRYNYVTGCAKGSRQYIPDEWGESPYVPPYEMEKMEEFGYSAMPVEAIWNYESYTTEEVCSFVPSFCEYNGIVPEDDGGRRRSLNSVESKTRKARRNLSSVENINEQIAEEMML